MSGLAEDVGTKAAAGAAAGSVVPGWGTAIGAGLGALLGLIQNSRENEQRNLALKARAQEIQASPWLQSSLSHPQPLNISGIPQVGQVQSGVGQSLAGAKGGAEFGNQFSPWLDSLIEKAKWDDATSNRQSLPARADITAPKVWV